MLLSLIWYLLNFSCLCHFSSSIQYSSLINVHIVKIFLRFQMYVLTSSISVPNIPISRVCTTCGISKSLYDPTSMGCINSTVRIAPKIYNISPIRRAGFIRFIVDAVYRFCPTVFITIFETNFKRSCFNVDRAPQPFGVMILIVIKKKGSFPSLHPGQQPSPLHDALGQPVLSTLSIKNEQ